MCKDFRMMNVSPPLFFCSCFVCGSDMYCRTKMVLEIVFCTKSTVLTLNNPTSNTTAAEYFRASKSKRQIFVKDIIRCRLNLVSYATLPAEMCKIRLRVGFCSLSTDSRKLRFSTTCTATQVGDSSCVTFGATRSSPGL